MITIDTVQPEDFEQTAALHKAYLKLGLFPRLGRHFLSRYQESFMRSPHGIALVARDADDGQVVGALFATTSNPDHYRWVVRNFGWELALAGCSALMWRPHLAWTFASTRLGRYARGLTRHIAPSSASAPVAGGARAPVSVLSHIVIDESTRRKGVGRKLVEEFKARARRKGVRRAVLVTEEGGLGAPFFEKIGCSLVGKRQGSDGHAIREYRLATDEANVHERIGRGRWRRLPDHRVYQPHLGAAARTRHLDTGYTGSSVADAR